VLQPVQGHGRLQCVVLLVGKHTAAAAAAMTAATAVVCSKSKATSSIAQQ
jgi:hypothetical protein